MSINERNEIEIYRFFDLFPKIWKIGEMKKAEKIRERAESCPTPTFILKSSGVKSFYKYCIFLPIK